ncbi:site specific DNA-methyltransferase [Chloroherpeton thalassium ATCC 35110]|uniref:site-specific DNA-methyltransferase (adenine-specific) n=1 Tax=Chloroherpeton thalassium (strain ATCC 35110 / GB-78) TaxID=517418 RepID=B3QWD4_CHLT3|nr:class I SAM-dependent methyltransferase [Chloroherpeton thalassium]ACF13247.1 site specific DNA-methyltransferase [Chloroherpeton thalassium ATCC 35110]
MSKVRNFGQVFTPREVVQKMLALRKNLGTVLEPSCGDGAFSSQMENCTAIEIDAEHCPDGALHLDFFDYPTHHLFETVIGNPPYVRYQDIPKDTKSKLDTRLFDERSNLYLFFIEKCLRHLKPHGELIFITPRDFLKATASLKLNRLLYEQGSFTDFIELGDSRVFPGYSPNCIIWRFEKGNFSRQTRVRKSPDAEPETLNFECANGQILFTKTHYPVHFRDIFFVKVGAVSGLDRVFTSEEHGNLDFVCSTTYRTGQTRRMIFNERLAYLEQFKSELCARRIKSFDETNWWTWGRSHYISTRPRIYVNCKTRNPRPFFLHESIHYDGSVLAIFPENDAWPLAELCDRLNAVDWAELGFICDGRFLFSQKSLENSLLPESFLPFSREGRLAV